MPHRIIEHLDPRAFHDRVIDHLVRTEAECCLLIGLVRRMARDGYSAISADERDRPILWTVENEIGIEAIALQTLVATMNVTRGSPGAMECLADALITTQWAGNSVAGVVPNIEPLVKRYAKLAGMRSMKARARRVFQLDRVTWPRPVTGTMHCCTSDDRDLLARFMQGFETDAGEPSVESTLSRADRAIADRRIFFWLDPHPVAMAAWAGPTPNGIRVNSVYTPPEFRGRRYASNLVAHLSQHLLDQGRRYCFLFTDQANPVSNHIYQQIGYAAVCDCERWDFMAHSNGN